MIKTFVAIRVLIFITILINVVLLYELMFDTFEYVFHNYKHEKIASRFNHFMANVVIGFIGIVLLIHFVVLICIPF